MNFLLWRRKPSTLTVLRFLGLLGVLQEYACGALGRAPGQDGVFEASLQKPMHSPGCGGADIVAELV